MSILAGKRVDFTINNNKYMGIFIEFGRAYAGSGSGESIAIIMDEKDNYLYKVDIENVQILDFNIKENI